jgi:hypothetical protein
MIMGDAPSVTQESLFESGLTMSEYQIHVYNMRNIDTNDHARRICTARIQV